ncbi:zinc-binding dehydrogenase [Streptomonospora sediminis]
MQAVQATRFGGPEVLKVCDVPEPVAGAGEVVVESAAADVLTLDALVRSGAPGPWHVRPPYIPGRGVAGHVVSVGPEVDPGLLGRRVAAKPGRAVAGAGFGSVAEAARSAPPTGGYAERVVTPAENLLDVPANLTLRAAAALVNDGMTAMLLSRATRPQPGETVLVAPAGGGLGSLLVQCARAAGATVIAAARGRHKLDLARRLGADRAFDYSAGDWTEQVRAATGGAGADVVLDGVGGPIGAASFGAAAHGARFVAFGAAGGGFTRIDGQDAQRQQVTVMGLPDMPMVPGDETRLAAAALAEASADRIAPTIGQVFALGDAAAAHRAVEERAVVGKTLLLP